MRLLRDLSRHNLRTTLTVIAGLDGVAAVQPKVEILSDPDPSVGFGVPNLAKVGASCDRIIRMRDGRIVADERVTDLDVAA